MGVTSFHVNIPQAALDDLRARLTRTRWPDEVEGTGWERGTSLGYLRELVAYWGDGFDWRAQERAMNRFAQFRADVDGLGLHVIHERGKGPRPLALLLTHGWPDSFLRMVKIIPLLADPAAHGGDAADAFDVVVPSLPGYGFSERPREQGFGAERFADLFATLMTGTLGYERFGAHGGDVGSSVTEQLARRHAGVLVGIHLTDVPYTHLLSVSPNDLSKAERATWRPARSGSGRRARTPCCNRRSPGRWRSA